MVKLASALSRLKGAKVVVMGDFCLDTYTFGKAKRISPEAPVPVILAKQQVQKPGGAGNVVMNLLALGAEVVAVGRKGDDWASVALTETLSKQTGAIIHLFHQKGFHLPVKNRIIADNQQVVRVDFEEVDPMPSEIEQEIISHFPIIFKDASVLALSDYGKGFLTPSFIDQAIRYARKHSITIITDPKGNDFARYRGTHLLKPNLGEAYAAANLPLSASLEQVAESILNLSHAETLMITRSEAGISLFHRDLPRQDFPVQAKEVKDVTGAGDTVLAVLAFCIANGLPYSEAIELCNLAAGIAIEHVGCAHITLSDLAARLLQTHPHQKVFDGEHFFLLEAVLKEGTYNLLKIPSDDSSLNHNLFERIKQAKEDDKHLLVYAEDADQKPSFIELLTSLREVSYILKDKEVFERLTK